MKVPLASISFACGAQTWAVRAPKGDVETLNYIVPSFCGIFDTCNIFAAHMRTFGAYCFCSASLQADAYLLCTFFDSYADARCCIASQWEIMRGTEEYIESLLESTVRNMLENCNQENSPVSVCMWWYMYVYLVDVSM